MPASGAGVERLFNCVRDICHYRRGQLEPDTIKDLMLHLFSSKFDLEKGELEMINEYLSAGEAAVADQMRKPVPTLDELEPISDNEEEGYEVDNLCDHSDESDDESDKEQVLTLTQITTQSKHTQHKRPRGAAEPQEDSDDGLPLPETPTKEGTQQRSGRIRKKPKLPDGFEIDRL